jgi:hypothetical protein
MVCSSLNHLLIHLAGLYMPKYATESSRMEKYKYIEILSSYKDFFDKIEGFIGKQVMPPQDIGLFSNSILISIQCQ